MKGMIFLNSLNANPVLLPDEVISRAKKLGTTLLSDGMEGKGSLNYLIKPVTKGTSLAGTALTVEMHPGDNLYLHQAIYSGGQGYIIIADGKDHKDNAYLGELMTLAAEAIGLNGIVIDGLVRDKEILNSLIFPIFAKGFIPNGPYKEKPGRINETISCGGVSVQPGDLILGDEDGVVIVPYQRIEEVFEKAEKKLAYEKKRLIEINLYSEKKKRGEYPGTIEPSWLKNKIT